MSFVSPLIFVPIMYKYFECFFIQTHSFAVRTSYNTTLISFPSPSIAHDMEQLSMFRIRFFDDVDIYVLTVSNSLCI